MPAMRTDLMLLAGPGDTSSIVYHHLAKVFGPFPVVMEEKSAVAQKLRVRMRKLGVFPVLSQLAFLALAKSVLTSRAQPAIERHCRERSLDRSAIPADVVTQVYSVNSDACRAILRTAAPKLIVVNGTRIIGKKTLAACPGQLINTHNGITPRYRGAHGGYWAMYNGDLEHCGVTVHLVDAGIDTGDVLGQSRIRPSANDCFSTYPYLQIGAALPILTECVQRGLAEALVGRRIEGTSEVWYHPGIGQYLGALARGVR